MASQAAFSQGVAIGEGRAEEQRAHKQALSDAELEGKIKEVQTNIGNLQTKISDLKPGTPDYIQANKALTDAIQSRNDLFHPVKNPGVLRKFGHLLKIGPKTVQQSVTTETSKPVTTPATTDPVKLAATEPYKQGPQGLPSQTPPAAAPKPGTAPDVKQTMAVENPKGLVEAGNIPIWNRPTIQNADGSHSSELSVSFADENGHEILVPTIVNGKFLTPDGKMPPGPPPKDYDSASPEWKALWDKAWKHYEETGQNLGKFDNAENADAYAGALHNRGNANQPGTAAAELPGLPTEPTTVAFPSQKVTVKGPAQTPKELKTQAENLRKAQTEASEIIAAAPMSQEQQQLLLSNAQDVARLNSIKTTLKSIPALLGRGATPEDIKRAQGDYLEKELGVLQKQNSEVVTGTIDGQPVSFLHDKSKTQDSLTELNGAPVPAERLAKFVMTGKTQAHPSTSQFNEVRDGYAKSHGFKAFDDLPADKMDAVNDYLIRKSALDRAFPTATTTTIMKQDVTGEVIPVTVTNYRTPGGNIKLVDPLSGVRGPEKPQGATPGSADNPHTVVQSAPHGGTSALVKEAKTRAPQAGAKPASSGPGNVKVGSPLFQGRTPAADKAKTALDAASTSYQDVQKASADPTPVGDQGVILAWLRGRVNRVTATEIAAVSNLGSAKLKLEANYVRIISGKMTDEQRAWFLKSAKDNYDIAKANYDHYINPPGAPAGGSGAAAAPNPEVDSIVDAINGVVPTK
jgi:hypothetical protein